MNQYTKILLALMCGMLIAVQSQSLNAADSPCLGEDGCVKGCCDSNNCEPCNVTCKFCIEKETKSRHCWKVECDYVCIPPVKFPWTKCCDLPCPKIRQINVLKKHKYKIDVCKFHWKLKKLWPCCDDQCIAE